MLGDMECRLSTRLDELTSVVGHSDVEDPANPFGMPEEPLPSYEDATSNQLRQRAPASGRQAGPRRPSTATPYAWLTPPYTTNEAPSWNNVDEEVNLKKRHQSQHWFRTERLNQVMFLRQPTYFTSTSVPLASKIPLSSLSPPHP